MRSMIRMMQREVDPNTDYRVSRHLENTCF